MLMPGPARTSRPQIRGVMNLVVVSLEDLAGLLRFSLFRRYLSDMSILSELYDILLSFLMH